MRLSELHKNESAVIIGIDHDCDALSRQRFLDLGFVKGVVIQVQNISPLRDPAAYLLHNTLISLRKEDAKMIMIEREREVKK